MNAPARLPLSGRPVAAVYRCVACGCRWRYEQVRTIARCRTCGCGLALCPEPAAEPARRPS